MVSWPRLCCATGGGFVGEKGKEEGWVGGKKVVGFVVVGKYTEAGLPKDRFDEGAEIS